jgi:hypothetical protein
MDLVRKPTTHLFLSRFTMQRNGHESIAPQPGNVVPVNSESVSGNLQ